jgi:KipI family sensor histidine kinase inhibitor
MSPTPYDPEILPYGLSGVIVRFAMHSSVAATAAVRAFHNALQAAEISGVLQTAGSLTTVFIEFDPTVTTRDNIQRQLGTLLETQDWLAATPPAPSRRWHIPVSFGGDCGPQLAETASLAGLTEHRAVDELTQNDVEVLTIGFAPGQPYLGLLPDHWNIPRQGELTPQVPAGALVVAVRQLVLFNSPSPTGWRWVGQCAFRPFFMDRTDPFLLKTGDAVRWVAVSASDMNDLLANNPDGLGGARCEVIA